MTRRAFTLTAVALAASLAFAWFRPGRASQAAPAPAANGAPAAEALAAESYVVEPSTVRETASAVGTLLANESVTIVGESSRRVAEVHFTEGALVQKGDVLLKLEDADLRAELHRLEGRRGLFAATEARQRELVGERLVSQQEYDRAQSELRAIDGEIEVLKVSLAKTEIRAPFSGRVGLRRVSEGAYIKPETPLTTLQDLSKLKLDFTLPERYADDVKPGQPLTFRIEGRGEVFAGRVAALEPQIDPGTRSLLVRGLVPNPQGLLTPGAFASLEIELGRKDGITVPSRALVPSIKGHSVFVLRDGKAAQQEVTIGARSAERVEILSGLKSGDTVLTSNLLRLRAGVPVKLLQKLD